MPTVVDVQGLHKQYGPTVAVDDISLQVQEGEIFGILGPNGAGKTTTVECIEGLRTADRGEISVLGLDPRRDRAQLTEVLGVQLQDSALPDRLRVAEASEPTQPDQPDQRKMERDHDVQCHRHAAAAP
jgi:ABC-2 type transport system ATP-binding protein